MKRFLVLASVAIVATSAGCVASAEPAPAEIAGAVLASGGREWKPIRVREGTVIEQRVGSLWLSSTKVEIVARDDDGKEVWRFTRRDAGRPVVLASEAGRLYLAERETDPPGATRILRVNAADGTREAELKPVVARPPGEKESVEVLAVLPGSEWTVSLAVTIREPESEDKPPKRTYTIAGFRRGESAPAWTKEMESEGDRDAAQGLLLAASYPNYADEDIRHLSWMGDLVVACAGPMEPVLCLDRKDGAVKWQVDRLWEFSRGFIGPSVWSHTLSRFGEDTFQDFQDKRDRKKEKEFYAAWSCSIVAGPVVLPCEEYPNDRVFVAVAKAAKGTWSGYTADCVLYEISSFGKLNSMITLPRFVRGSDFALHEGGLVWAGQEGSLMRLVPSESVVGGGPGGPDMIGRLDWYRQYSKEVPGAWLTSDKWADPVVFADGRAVRLASGGYALKAGDRDMRFDFSIVDLATGVDRRFVLRVPMKSPIKPPSSNYSATETTVHAMGWHLLTVGDLQLSGDEIHFTVANDEWMGLATFDWRELRESSGK